MSELEPETEPSQWLWFGAALLAMTFICIGRDVSKVKPLSARSGCAWVAI
jgi:hypothetical protein